MAALRRIAAMAAAGGVFTAALVACLTDFEVLPPESPDSGSTVDATPPPPPPPGEDATVPPPPVDAGPDGPTNFCATAPKPVGATDYFCADFDVPSAPFGGLGAWTAIQPPDGGPQKVQNVFNSPPNAILVNAPFSGTGGTSLTWNKTGSQSFLEATARMLVNPTISGGVFPATPGSIDLMEIRTDFVTVITLSHTLDSGNSGLGSGFYLRTSVSAGAAAQNVVHVPGTLPPNQWTDITLVYKANGKVSVFINNNLAHESNQFSATSSNITFQVGQWKDGAADAVLVPWRIDDVLLWIKR